MAVALAVNDKYVGKVPEGAPRHVWRSFNVSFDNFMMPLPRWLGHIRRGHAYTTQHSTYRRSDRFLKGQHLGLDFDTEDEQSTFDFLLRDPFIQRYASFLHTTASHRPDAPRARVVFVLDKPISDRETYTNLAKALLFRYGSADPACKDPVRLFFGAPGCEIELLGNTLPLGPARVLLLKPYLKDLEEREARRAAYNASMTVASLGSDAKEIEIEKHLQKILDAPHGSKYNTMFSVSVTIGGFVGSGYFTFEEAASRILGTVLQRNIDSVDTAKKGIVDALRIGAAKPLHIRDEWAELFQ